MSKEGEKQQGTSAPFKEKHRVGKKKEESEASRLLRVDPEKYREIYGSFMGIDPYINTP